MKRKWSLSFKNINHGVNIYVVHCIMTAVIIIVLLYVLLKITSIQGKQIYFNMWSACSDGVIHQLKSVQYSHILNRSPGMSTGQQGLYDYSDSS